MKPTKLSLEEPQEQLHRIPFTLSSKNVKNPEKECADLNEEQAADGEGYPVIDLVSYSELVQQITTEPGMEVEVTIAER
ncbi:hypothetical protein OPV22_008730 [Ensete ventricosum]|uniref:Uncharacterized protein n=1 Tax=Ensete ventricosum TaxID=4639 RepID=A0AAV8RH91_ENSVE|nr:hypothetical protein OPV22_008730 [Ensete ventricosum]